MEEISIFLKLPDGSSVDLRTLPSTTVLQMKEMLLSSKRLQAEKAQDLVVIFAGQVLQDYQSLQVRPDGNDERNFRWINAFFP
jgi:Ubiquitin family